MKQMASAVWDRVGEEQVLEKKGSGPLELKTASGWPEDHRGGQTLEEKRIRPLWSSGSIGGRELQRGLMLFFFFLQSSSHPTPPLVRTVSQSVWQFGATVLTWPEVPMGQHAWPHYTLASLLTLTLEWPLHSGKLKDCNLRKIAVGSMP